MKILVCDGVSTLGVDILQKEFEVDVKPKLSKEELLEIIGQYDALVVRSQTKVTADVLAVADNLKAIGRAGVGVDNIDVAAATKKGIVVMNAPEGNTIAATEHTMAMMLALARNLPQAYLSVRAGKWERSKFTGVELRGKTLGIIGLGRIGAGVAKRAAAMDMTLLGYDPYISAERADKLGIKLAELDEIYTAADFITVHMPLTPETKGLINKDSFAKMKKGVRLVNCARGGIIHEADLLAAVEAGIVAGAAIDVFEKEPVDFENSPLLKSDKIIVTPHLGASTTEAQVGVAVDVAHGIVAALRGEPVSTAVNMAPIPGNVLDRIKPYFSLGEKMGCLGVHLAGRINSIEVEYTGEISEVDTKMLTTAIVKGVLNPMLKESVNYVNAPGLAKERGIKVKEVKSKNTVSFADLIVVKVTDDKGEHTVAGTLFGAEGRIVNIDGHRVDVNPRGWLLLSAHINRPGIVGKVGTVLGGDDINISGMQVGRTAIEGTSIMALGVDSEIPAETLAKIVAIDGIIDAKMINFDRV
ncbi:MAG: phosphoglycerate dehydrogenase [Pelosinus sp.]|nr:phosphoglycerate dehydrogenase [Pelosinus sp.]